LHPTGSGNDAVFRSKFISTHFDQHLLRRSTMAMNPIEQPTTSDFTLAGPDATAAFEPVGTPSNPTEHASSETLWVAPRTPALDEEDDVEEDPDEEDDLDDEDEDLEDDEDEDDDLEDDDDDLEDEDEDEEDLDEDDDEDDEEEEEEEDE
jgi:hypothetical protein